MVIMNFFLPYKWFKAEDYYGQNLMVPYKLLESRNIKKHEVFTSFPNRY